MHRRALVWLVASALGALGAADAFSAARHKPMSQDRKKVAEVAHHKRVSPHRKKTVEVEHHKHLIEQPADRDAAAPLPPDLAAAKQAIELVRRGKPKDATALAASISDPVAAKLVEWALLRQFDSEAGFDRYVAFMRANPNWPSMPLLRRRAEVRLWRERRDGTTVRRFVGEAPTGAIGRLALARVERGEGDRADAESEVRAVWHSAQLSPDLEAEAIAVRAFPALGGHLRAVAP